MGATDLNLGEQVQGTLPVLHGGTGSTTTSGALTNLGAQATLSPQVAYVATQESTSGSTYVDLTTTTDSVTATIGASGSAMVFISAYLGSAATASSVAFVSFAMSGANTQAADDSFSITARNYSTVAIVASGGNCFLLTGLAPGSTTFKMKYKANSTSTSFQYRRIAVIPL